MAELLPKVALVSLPWGPPTEPSLGIGILKETLNVNSIECRVFDFTINLLEHLRYDTYLFLSNRFALNDFLFTHIYEPTLSHDQLEILVSLSHEYYTEWEGCSSPLDFVEKVLVIRNEVIPLYLERCAQEVFEWDPTLIGLTCMFDQTYSSLAFSKYIKSQGQNNYIVLGGYAADGDVGKYLLSTYNEIDFVSNSDGEQNVVDLALLSVGHKNPIDCNHIFYRDDNGVIAESRPRKRIDLDSSCPPNYDDFYKRVSDIKERKRIEITPSFLPVETSRGCWWGQKSHCTFCGIDDITMLYRSKSPKVALSHLASTYSDYETSLLRLSDYILPHHYYKELLPKLAKKGADLEIACEIKSNVKPWQIEQLKMANVVDVQPGIESFDTDTLKLMKKGTSGIQNVFLVKSLDKKGIHVHYNILYGFPGENIYSYERLTRVIPQLNHLTPPVSNTRISITRHSPLQTDPLNHGLPKSPRYHPRYNLIFSESFRQKHSIDHQKQEYYFEYDYRPSLELDRWHQVLNFQINSWRALHENDSAPILTASFENQFLVVSDSRFNKKLKNQVIGDVITADIYRLIDEEPLPIEKIASNIGVPDYKLNEHLDLLLHHRIILNMDGKYLGLCL